MKKLFLALSLSLVGGTAMAQWTSDFTKNTPVSDLESTGNHQPKVHETPDGKIWVAWLQWADGMNSYVKAQLLDKQGNPLLDEGGIYVGQHITATWHSNFDMQVTPDGGCVIVHSDSRNDPEGRQTFEPYAYKLDQEGNQLWGLDGIKLPTKEAKGHRPKIGITRQGAILVGYNDVVEPNMQYQIMKINDDGTLAWQEPMPVDGAFGVFMPCEEDDLYLSIIQNGKIMLYRMDSLGDYVWDTPVTVEARDPNTRAECVPMSDGKGGAIMAFQRYINLSRIVSCVQRITPDGETTMGLLPMDISDEPGIQSVAGVGVNPDREEMVLYWSDDRGPTEHLMVQKFSYYGDPIWEEPIELDSFVNFGYATCEGKVLDDGSSILVVGDMKNSIDFDLRIIRLDNDGNKEWDKLIAPRAYMSTPYPVWDDDQAYLIWTDNRVHKGPTPSGTIWGQNFSYATGEGGEVSVEEIVANTADVKYCGGKLSFEAEGAGMVEVFNASGAKVAAYSAIAGHNEIAIEAAGGIFIVRISDAAGVRTGKLAL